MSKRDYEIFDGKTFQDLTKDIYETTITRKNQLNELIREIHDFIKGAQDAVIIAPIIKEYMEVSVKNDEHLVRLASVLQRIMVKSTGGENEETMLLSDYEKEELMSTLQDTANELQKEYDGIENIKKKTPLLSGE